MQNGGKYTERFGQVSSREICNPVAQELLLLLILKCHKRASAQVWNYLGDGRSCRSQNTKSKGLERVLAERSEKVLCFSPMKRTFALRTSVLMLLGLGPAALAQEKVPPPTLVVVNQGDHDISLVDPAARRQIATVDVDGITGHEAVVSPDGRTAYVPVYGNSGVGRAGTDGNRMVAIDLASRKITGALKFDHGVRPHCVRYNPHDGLLYLTTELDQSITLVDPRTLKIVGTIPTGQPQSHMFVLSPDGRFGYTANVGPGTVSVLDIAARETLAIIPISSDTQRISISNDGRMVFTADQTAPRLAVIDTTKNAIKTWIELPSIGYGTTPTPDGRWLLVALRTNHQVAVVDLKTLKVARTLDVPAMPTEILVRPDGRVAYVSCTGKAQVAAIDLNHWKLEALIDAGKGADGLAWGQ
jgi:DNA-binding beta-propeller fold protein YncE